MSLTLATLIPALLLLALGAALLVRSTFIVSALKAFPRSPAAAVVFFGAGAAWFLYRVAHLSVADFGEYRTILFVAFAAIAVLSFWCVPDFLAVRGLAILTLVGAMPLLDAAFTEYQHPQRLFMVTVVFLAISAAIWLGAQPWRLRDFFEWLFRVSNRSRLVGGVLLGYGALLAVVAFTY